MLMIIKAKYSRLLFLLPVMLLLTGCSLGGEETPAQLDLTAVNTPPNLQETATATIQPTATTPPRRLSICLAAEPETLFIYGGVSLEQRHILEAIYDGPVDTVGYQNHPVILEKLPDLKDGDARLEPVPVQAGAWVVNNDNQLVELDLGDVVRPFGCIHSDCAVTWDGGPLEMAQLSATFTLLPDLKWADGTPLTAADSVFSYQVASQCPADFGPCGGLGLTSRSGWDTVPRTASYLAIDERSLRWTGVPGYLDQNYQMNFFIPLPEHQLARYDPEELFSLPETTRQPMGWGPYVITSWTPGVQVTLRANPLYFRASQVQVMFDELIFRFIANEPENALEFVLNGECDFLDQGVGQIIMEGGMNDLFGTAEGGQLLPHFTAGPVWEHADFGIQPLSYDDGYQPGVDRPNFFSDVNVRQAFALCMDRQRIVEQVLFGNSSVPSTFFPEEHPLFEPSVNRYAFDPAAGSLLLQQAGWVDFDADPQTPRQAVGVQGVIDGTPLVVTYRISTATQRRAASQILAESLAECGITLDVISEPGGEVYAPGPEGPVFGRRFDLAQFAWASGSQPACSLWSSRQIPGDPNLVSEDGTISFPYGWGGINASGFRDSAYDFACEQAIGTLPGQPGYLDNIQSVQVIFSEQLPVVPLYQHIKLVVTRPDICNFTIDSSASSELWNIEAIDYGEDCQ